MTPVFHLHMLKIQGLMFPPFGVVLNIPGLVFIIVMYFVTLIVSSHLDLLFPSCLLLTSHLFLLLLSLFSYPIVPSFLVVHHPLSLAEGFKPGHCQLG